MYLNKIRREGRSGAAEAASAAATAAADVDDNIKKDFFYDP